MSKFSSVQKVGDIVVQFPMAADVFKEYKIDFCCGGDKPLATAINEQNLNESEILGKLNSLYEQFSKDQSNKNWEEANTAELVDQIVNKHHAYLWAELPKISQLTSTILRVHGPNHPELVKVHKLFNTMKMELESHLMEEETIQYPAIKKYIENNSEADLDDAIRIIDELEQEHTGAGDILKELRVVTDDYVLPDDACETFELTYSKLQELEDDLFLHIHLENNILFPRLKSKNA